MDHAAAVWQQRSEGHERPYRVAGAGSRQELLGDAFVGREQQRSTPGAVDGLGRPGEEVGPGGGGCRPLGDEDRRVSASRNADTSSGSPASVVPDHGVKPTKRYCDGQSGRWSTEPGDTRPSDSRAVRVTSIRLQPFDCSPRRRRYARMPRCRACGWPPRTARPARRCGSPGDRGSASQLGRKRGRHLHGEEVTKDHRHAAPLADHRGDHRGQVLAQHDIGRCHLGIEGVVEVIEVWADEPSDERAGSSAHHRDRRRTSRSRRGAPDRDRSLRARNGTRGRRAGDGTPGERRTSPRAHGPQLRSDRHEGEHIAPIAHRVHDDTRHRSERNWRSACSPLDQSSSEYR